MLQVHLDPGIPGGRWAVVRELCGHDEQLLGAGGGAALVATDLLDRVLVAQPGTTVGPGRAWDLPVCDRDRLLAAIYTSVFGDRIESVVPCRACEKGSEISFSLATLVSSIVGARDAGGLATGPDEQCHYSLSGGLRLRLPAGADQRAVIGLPPERARVALLHRCIVADEQGRTPSDLDPATLDRVEAAMAALAPIIEHELEFACHECGASQRAHFDIQSFLLRGLEHERRFLVREIHYIASGYGWSLAEILGLTRSDRRRYVELLLAERSHRHRRSLS